MEKDDGGREETFQEWVGRWGQELSKRAEKTLVMICWYTLGLGLGLGWIFQDVGDSGDSRYGGRDSSKES